MDESFNALLVGIYLRLLIPGTWGDDPTAPSHTPADSSFRPLLQRSPSALGVVPETHDKILNHDVKRVSISRVDVEYEARIQIC